MKHLFTMWSAKQPQALAINTLYESPMTNPSLHRFDNETTVRRSSWNEKKKKTKYKAGLRCLPLVFRSPVSVGNRWTPCSISCLRSAKSVCEVVSVQIAIQAFGCVKKWSEKLLVAKAVFKWLSWMPLRGKPLVNDHEIKFLLCLTIYL